MYCNTRVSLIHIYVLCRIDKILCIVCVTFFSLLWLSIVHGRRLYALKAVRDLKHKKLQHNSAVLIQRCYRRYMSRMKERIEDTLNKIITAQSGVRMHLAKQKRRKLKFFMSVLVVQRIMHKFGHKVRMRKKRKERQIILTQAVARGYLAKKRVEDIKFLKATVIVQCALRRQLAKIRKRKLMYIRDIVITQSIARRYLAYRVVRPMEMERNRNRCALRIQCFFRCWKAWKVVDHLRFVRATIHIQSCLRRFKASVHVRILRQRKCVCTLQKHWRGYLVRQSIKQRKSAIIIQSIWRGHVARQAVAPQLKKYRAIIKLQCSYRCYRARRKLRHKKRRRLRKEFETVHNKRINDGIHTRLKRNAGNIKKALATDAAAAAITMNSSSPPPAPSLSPASSIVRKAKAGPVHISNAFDPSQVLQFYDEYIHPHKHKYLYAHVHTVRILL